MLCVFKLKKILDSKRVQNSRLKKSSFNLELQMSLRMSTDDLSIFEKHGFFSPLFFPSFFLQQKGNIACRRLSIVSLSIRRFRRIRSFASLHLRRNDTRWRFPILVAVRGHGPVTPFFAPRCVCPLVLGFYRIAAVRNRVSRWIRLVRIEPLATSARVKCR